MKIVVIGTGRMGRILAARLATRHEVLLYDNAFETAQTVAADLELRAVDSLAGLAADGAVLAVPDGAVADCIQKLRATGGKMPLFNVATNISREMLATLDESRGLCLNVKIVGHAGEMNRGAVPILIADNVNAALADLAGRIFAPVGEVVIGEADQVTEINVVMTEEALKAGVAMEKALLSAGVADQRMIRAALSIVGTGVLRAYAEDDLGPFARQIVKGLHDKMSEK